MLWIWSYPVSKKDLLLKSATPKKQAKSLKIFVRNFVFIAFADCRAEILFTHVSQGFSKTRMPPPCTQNSKKPHNPSFWKFLSSSIYYSFPFMFSNFRSIFTAEYYMFKVIPAGLFLGTPPSGCFSLHMPECYTKKIK